MRAYVEALGTRITQTRFERMGSAAINAKPVMEQVADLMMDVIGTNFESQGRRGGGSWKRDSPEWLARKMRKGLDPRIGHATGALRAAMTKRGAPGQDLQVRDDSVRLGTTLPYARRFNAGRPFIKFSPADRERIRQMVRNYLIAAWRSA